METHILFFILAGILIAILIGAGVWSARREKSKVFSNTFSTRPPSSPINTGLNSDVPASLSSTGFNGQPMPTDPQQAHDQFAQTHQHEIEQSVSNIKISLPTNSPNHSSTQEQAVFSEADSAYTAQASSPMPTIQLDTSSDYPSETQDPQAEPTTDQAPTMITLYVVAAEGQQFYGESVVQNLEALGFQYGEYQIFHRHLDNATSPVLFSVANMMQPGIFDLNNLDQFATVGLTFFMQLPSAGNDVVNVRMLINVAESFAQSVGGFVLNDQYQLFDEHSRNAYLLKATAQ